MARALTRDGVTTITGPGAYIAGAFLSAIPLDDSPESAAEARETDAALVAHWLRTLTAHEADIQAALDAGETERADRLWRAVERTASVQELLETLDARLDLILTNGGIVPSERSRARLRGVVSGGRDERTWRSWRSGRQLVPEGAAEYLGRVRDITLVRSRAPGAPGLRLRIEIATE